MCNTGGPGFDSTLQHFFHYEVAIGLVTGHVLQSYRYGNHVKLNLEARAQYYKQSQRNQETKIFVFVCSNPFLLSHIIEINGATRVKYNYCLNREKFRWLHVQMITGVGLLVVIYPFQETKLVG